MTTEIDGLYVCPYNKSHVLEWNKLPNHLVKCRKNNPRMLASIVICPYNQCHHVPKQDLEMHLTNCKDHHTFKALALKPASRESFHRPTPKHGIDEEKEPRSSHNVRAFSNALPNSTNVLNPSDAYAIRQHEKNLADLDEWLVE